MCEGRRAVRRCFWQLNPKGGGGREEERDKERRREKGRKQ